MQTGERREALDVQQRLEGVAAILNGRAPPAAGWWESIHGSRSRQKLSTSSAEILASVSPASSLDPTEKSGWAHSASTRARVHAARANNGHERKLEAMTALLNQMKTLREQPVLSSKLRQIAGGLAKVMVDSPDSAAFLENDDIENKLRIGAFSSFTVAYCSFWPRLCP